MSGKAHARAGLWASGYGIGLLILWLILSLVDPDGAGVDGVVLFALGVVAFLNVITYTLIVGRGLRWLGGSSGSAHCLTGRYQTDRSGRKAWG